MKLKFIYSLLLGWAALLAQDANSQEKENPKTLVLIICSDNLPVFKGFQEVWRSYMHLDPPHFECYFIRSDPELTSEFLIKEDVIWSRGQESLVPGLLNKTILSLEAMLLRLDEFDYVLRTNLSSFYVFPNLLEFLKYAPQEQFYCGIHHGRGDSQRAPGWICGAGILMSVDLAKMLLSYKEKLLDLPYNPIYNVDDVVIAGVFVKKGIRIVPGLQREIDSVQDWKKMEMNIPEDVFHFRIKTPEANRLIVDLSIHSALLAHFYNINIPVQDLLSLP